MNRISRTPEHNDDGYKNRQKMLIDAQDKVIEELNKKLHKLSEENLKQKEHIRILIMHPVGLAAKIISERYSPEKITKELQISFTDIYARISCV